MVLLWRDKLKKYPKDTKPVLYSGFRRKGGLSAKKR